METKKIAIANFPAFLKKKEVCAILRCSYREVNRIIERGDLRYDYKRGGTILFKEETIHAYLESIKVRIN
ncbi:MAG: helix-turn-helix domain-containing protein [Tannerellaceae bacterium]|jgi:excisionase family DNA binding protein|nr:helix-turn-helix domain-containing protein [Tannerellaceae bacterium]